MMIIETTCDHGVTCYPTQVNVSRLNHNPQAAGGYSIYLSRVNGRLS